MAEIWKETELRGSGNGTDRTLPKGGIDVTPRIEDRWTPVEELRADYVVNGVRVIIANGTVKLVDENAQGVEVGPEDIGEEDAE